MIYKINLENLKSYLINKGWTIDNFNEKAYEIKTVLDGEEFKIIIPKNDDLQDYEIRINRLLKSLSTIEKRDYNKIAEEIESIGFDTMRIRFVSDKNYPGTMPLKNVGSVIKNIEDMIKFEACSEINKQSQYSRPYEEALDLVANCKFAQTSVGSFIFNIKIPFDEIYIKNIEELEDYLKDLGRRTLIRLIGGINEAKNVNLIDEKDFRENYDKKLNKNTCDSINELLNNVKDGASIEIHADWNERKRLESSVESSAHVTEKDSEIFETMSGFLRKLPEEEEITVSGDIKKIERDDEKTITVYDENLKRKIYIPLNEDDFKNACDFIKNQRSIKIKGILKKENGKWILKNYENFIVNINLSDFK